MFQFFWTSRPEPHLPSHNPFEYLRIGELEDMAFDKSHPSKKAKGLESAHMRNPCASFRSRTKRWWWLNRIKGYFYG
uniref:Uncharacterized protein n=1 Tax=Lepeophtheirus salmonis TaxID=72036 RepID=A0A0K2UT60_LEPSM